MKMEALRVLRRKWNSFSRMFSNLRVVAKLFLACIVKAALLIIEKQNVFMIYQQRGIQQSHQ